MRFRTKLVEIDAIQYTGENGPEVIGWARGLGGRDKEVFWHPGLPIVVKTLEGDMAASPGDWIIRGLVGEFYPCKSEVFEKKYEAL